jgi:hypothetical protein
MLGRLPIGAERVHCQTYLPVEAIAVTAEALALTSAESAEREISRAMAKLGISETGRERDLFPLFRSRSVAPEMEDAHGRTMAHTQMASEIGEHPQLSGARAVPHRAPRMEVRDPRDVNSRSDLPLSAHQLLPSRIISGAPR